jgi:Piwi domain
MEDLHLNRIVTDGTAGSGKDDYQVHLNFLPVELHSAHCLIYRRRCESAQQKRPMPRATAHKLPAVSADEKQWLTYWVLPEAAEGFESFEYRPSWNADLTRRILFGCLKRSVESSLQPQQYQFPPNSFIQEVSLIMATHAEGNEALVVQPYFLKASRQTGFLVDFHFNLRREVPFSRRVQQLSLSLDKNFRRNVDYYVDRSSKVRRFLEGRWSVFEGLRLPGASEPLKISKDFVALPAERLRPKIYVFAGAKESRGQFTGLRDFGPLQPLESPPRLLFAFREQDRQAARRLALALRGQKQRGQFNFPGFNELFKTALEIDANPIILPDLSSASMEAALRRAQTARESSPRIVPVIVLPNGDDNGYLALKAHFSHAGLPTQVCTLRILEDEESLKWSIGNLALQIFCKAGGRPWKVRPTMERSLIIGISQSHKSHVVDDQVHIDKYFAFSVLTDSSGLFQQIQVLGDATDRSTYVDALRANLKRVLEENAGVFNRVVIHTSFTLKGEEIRAIQQTTRDVAAATDRSKCRFSVIKVNHKNRFFGINRSVNSLVPYEATKVQLGPHEYLVWFEGIYPDKPNVTKAFPGPTHLQFLRVDVERTEPAEDRELLQDLVNLSGANWRGFNAKSSPVSVFYCHLVADLVHHFHEQGLPMPAVQDIQPWFL